MRIGIDLDNTIINYEPVYKKIALEYDIDHLDWIDIKSELKKNITDKLGNGYWTKFQAEIYGPRIVDTECFSGFIEVLDQLIISGHQIYIISHKTEFPYAQQKWNLREYAISWLKNNKIIDANRLSLDQVFFADSIELKIDKISKLECDVFVDDLLKVINHQNFPQKTKKIWFTKLVHHDDLQTLNHWDDFMSILQEEIG